MHFNLVHGTIVSMTHWCKAELFSSNIHICEAAVHLLHLICEATILLQHSPMQSHYSLTASFILKQHPPVGSHYSLATLSTIKPLLSCNIITIKPLFSCIKYQCEAITLSTITALTPFCSCNDHQCKAINYRRVATFTIEKQLLSATSYINCFAARCLINVVYLTACCLYQVMMTLH